MGRHRIVTLVLVMLAGSVTLAGAQTIESQPIQISLVTPIQIVSPDKAVTGFRLDLIYGRNAYVVGLDVGLVNRNTVGVSQGLQWGVVNLVDAQFQGWQHGVVNVTKMHFEGLQSGGVNSLGTGRGVQFGIVNVAEQFNGLQLGIVNYTQRLDGLQIGLVNIIKQGGAFPVFPIVNWSF